MLFVVSPGSVSCETVKAVGVPVIAVGRVLPEVAEEMLSGGECDFVNEVALHFPLHVIMTILGVPESDEPRMLQLTQELFGGQDPDLQRSATPEENAQVLMDFYRYFTELTADRMERPTDDLATLIANGVIVGMNDSAVASRESGACMTTNDPT